MTTITREEVKAFIEQIESDLSNGWEAQIFELKLARIALASLEAEPVSQPYKLPEEKGASLQLRNLIRKRHAEWSDSTFGNVGPVGPLKHLSKEALEAAAEPGDLSEWADMQFLLWDAQRRAGITDEQITQAMVEKLAVNKQREWPEPKDGEPRLHIKEQPVPVVPDYASFEEFWSSFEHPFAEDDEMKSFAVEIWNACRAAMLNGGKS
ncbi:dATP/dGTP pyrophosphohydrolase domain-containing protein [Salmonella enterica]